MFYVDPDEQLQQQPDQQTLRPRRRPGARPAAPLDPDQERAFMGMGPAAQQQQPPQQGPPPAPELNGFRPAPPPAGATERMLGAGRRPAPQQAANDVSDFVRSFRLQNGLPTHLMNYGLGEDNDRLAAGNNQAFGQGLDQAMRAYAQAGDEANQQGRLALDQYLGVGRLGQDQQRLSLEKQLGRGRLDLEGQRVALERALGMGRLDQDAQRLALDRTLGTGQLDVARQKANTEAELGRGNLDVARQRAGSEADLGRGQLALGQRKQTMDEQKQTWDMDQDRDGQRLADAMLARGATPAEVRAAMELRRRLGYGARSQQQQQQQGDPQQPAGGGVGPVGGAVQQPGGGGGGGVIQVAQPGGGRGRQQQQQPPPPPAVVQDDERFRGAFGDQLTQELEDLRAGKAGEGKQASERMLATARLLAQRMDRPENANKPEVRQAMLDYMRTNYGPEFDEFIRPSQTRQMARRFGNFFGEPSQEEVLSSQWRDLAGAGERPASGLETIAGTLLGASPIGTVYGQGTAAKRLREGGPLWQSLLEGVPFRQAFKPW